MCADETRTCALSDMLASVPLPVVHPSRQMALCAAFATRKRFPESRLPTIPAFHRRRAQDDAVSKGRPMVKNRAAKMAARSRAAQQGISYTQALAPASPREAGHPLSLVLGLDPAGQNVSWPSRTKGQTLLIQGPAESGKTTLLRRLAVQAADQADVYVCSNSGRLTVPGAAGYGGGFTSSVEIIRALVTDIEATAAEGRRMFDASVTAKERTSLEHRTRLALNPTEGLRALPEDRRPPRRVLVIDDFELICRNWEWTGTGDIRTFAGPESLVGTLVKDGGDMDVSVILTGESLSRSASYIRGSRLLLGPSTLAERESFLISDAVANDPGRWAGLFESGFDEAVKVSLPTP